MGEAINSKRDVEDAVPYRVWQSHTRREVCGKTPVNAKAALPPSLRKRARLRAQVKSAILSREERDSSFGRAVKIFDFANGPSLRIAEIFDFVQSTAKGAF